MWCSDRRGALVLLAGVLAGCGFRPLYGEGGGAGRMLGAVALQEAASPEDFAYRERLRRRLGSDEGAGAPEWRLSWSLRFDETGIAITREADVTRYRLIASAKYTLERLDGSTPPVLGEVRAIGAYDATSSTYSTLSAERAELGDLAVELAELTATRLLADAARPEG